jgi:hypothetical protein
MGEAKSEKEKERYFKYKEVSHVLGLKNNSYLFGDSLLNENEGWNIQDAVKSIQDRYKKLTGKQDKEIAYENINKSTKDEFSKKIVALNQGGYYGVGTSLTTGMLSRHAVSLHAIKDKEGTHFVYVNRGSRPVIGGKVDTSVRVFTVPDDKLKDFSKEIHAAFASGSPQQISDFIKNNESYSTPPVKLKKTDQKVGNCSIANSNIAWHFQLASDYLKDHPEQTYDDALDKTKGEYKELRVQDRIEAFKALLAQPPAPKNPADPTSPDAHWNNILQALYKFNRKSKAPQGTNYIQRLLQDPEVAPKLKSLLKDTHFEAHLKNFITLIPFNSNPSDVEKEREIRSNEMNEMRTLITTEGSLKINEEFKQTEENGKKENAKDQAFRILTHIMGDKDYSKPEFKVALIYAANDKQAKEFYDCYEKGNLGSLPNLKGSGQALLFKEIINLLNEISDPENPLYAQFNGSKIKEKIQILPFATSMKGGENKKGNTVSESELIRDLENIRKHIKDGYSVQGIPNKDGGYAIGGQASKHWFSQKYVGVTYTDENGKAHSMSQGEFVQCILKKMETNPDVKIEGTFKLDQGLYYNHATSANERGRKFHAFKASYQGLTGDAAKTQILTEFKNSLAGLTKAEIAKEYENFQQEDNSKYQILKKGQGLATQIFSLKTDSLAALEKIAKEAQEQAPISRETIKHGK